MSAHDISRHLLQTANHYTGLRMQQGRVILDSDFNEARMLDEEEQRAVVVDVIGPHGSPDSGFGVANVVTVGTYNFDILAGTYYLGGHRHEISGTSGPLSPQTFLAQSDWVQSTREVDGFPLPTIPTQDRNDFVYLVGWQQGVTAVEDGEFREQAIAEHDTGYRIRQMHRVLVRTGSPDNCKDAFAALVASLVGNLHSFDYANFELKSGARLKVLEDDGGAVNDMCTPAVLQGFAGAENQAIRVQLVAPTRFIWGLENASVFHRVTVTVGGQVTLKVPPRDVAHMPQIGQIVEILPWGAKLSNGEYTADHPIAVGVGGGVLTRITTAYDPIEQTFNVEAEDGDLLGDLITWFEDQTIPEGQRYLFARVWHPGDVALGEAAPGEFGLTFTPGQHIPLAGTGLKLQFGRPGIVGDYWIIGSRPSTPHPIVPWDLGVGAGASPHGPRRFYSPLAVVQWRFIIEEEPYYYYEEDPEPVLELTVYSCRRTFRPLNRRRGCCNVTVGDGKTSFGDFTSINEAIRALPLDEPGKLCILPGEYHERVEIEGRTNIVIEGCGARTILRTPEGNATSQGLITLLSCAKITIRALTLEAIGQMGVMMHACSEAWLDRLTITTRRDAALPPPEISELWIPTGSSSLPLSTIADHEGASNRVTHCRLTMIGDLSAAANITLVSCDGATVSDCEILTPAPSSATTSQAWGGIFISEGAHFVLSNNTIRDGLGCGITLGGLSMSTPDPGDHTWWFDPEGRFVLSQDNDCPGNNGTNVGISVRAPGGGGFLSANVSGLHEDGVIRNNHISGMGSSGISVVAFGSLQEVYWDDILVARFMPMIETHRLIIADNTIQHCFKRPGNPLLEPDDEYELSYEFTLAFGGITLAAADDLEIHDNVIQDNGVDHRHPVCGIYVQQGDNGVIENNLIRGNGLRVDDMALAGVRAGIAIHMAGRREQWEFLAGQTFAADRLLPAARIRGNVVVQPAGRALQIYGMGAMLIEGNVFVSEGLPEGPPTTGPHCVEVVNLGQSPELAASAMIPADIAIFPAPPLLYDPGEQDDNYIDGRILFTDNQVRLAPPPGLALNIDCATRLHSYGDVAVLDNQFFTSFPPGEGSLANDTVVVAWSTRVNNNRWEDPVDEITPGVYRTDASATTLALMNFTALNQASRCIHIYVSGSSPVTTNNPNPDTDNQTYTTCIVPGFSELLAPP